MNYQHYIGIDVSKEKLDIVSIQQQGEKQGYEEIENSPAGIKRWLCMLKKSIAGTLFCLEPTGHYSNLVVALLLENKARVWVANPSDIRHSIGMQRGKNDKIDAGRIAEYAFRFKDKARLAEQSEVEMQAVKQLLAQREMLVIDRAKYSSQIEDFKERIGKESYRLMKKNNQGIIAQIEKAIVVIETELQHKIESIPAIKQIYDLLLSIPGIGKVVASTLIAFTNGFERFSDARALACHSGIAPFEYKSGSSIRGRNRVSHRSNKRLKSLLHMAALAAIKTKGDLKGYYERKVAEGKNRMSVLNAIRNKIIHRVFAVLKRNSPYINLEIS
jgi:transposase